MEKVGANSKFVEYSTGIIWQRKIEGSLTYPLFIKNYTNFGEICVIFLLRLFDPSASFLKIIFPALFLKLNCFEILIDCN